MKKLLSLVLLFTALSAAGAVNSTATLLRNAEKHIEAKKYSKALPFLLKAAEDTAARPIYKFNIHVRLGDAYWNLGHPQAAFNAYEKAIASGREVKNLPAIDSLIFNTAQLYTEYGKYEDACNLLENVGFAPGSEPWLRSRALAATILSRMGENKHALNILNETIQSYPADNPNRAVALQNKGYILWQEMYAGEAEEALSEAISAMDGRNKYLTLSNLAMVHSDLEDYDKALAEIEEVLRYFKAHGGEKGEDYIMAFRKKGEILYQAERKQEALATFRRFISLEKERLVKALPEMSAQTRLNYWTMEKPLLSRALISCFEDPSFAADVALMRHHTSLWGMNDMDALKAGLKFDEKALKKILPENAVAIQFAEFEPFYGSNVYIAIITPKSGPSKALTLFSSDYLSSVFTLDDGSIQYAVTHSDKDIINQLYTNETVDRNVWKEILDAIPAGTKEIYFTPEGIFHLWGIEHMPSARNSGIKMHRLSSFQQLAQKNRKEADVPLTPALVAGGLHYSPDTKEDIFAIGADTAHFHDDAECDYDAYERLTDYLNVYEVGFEIFSYLPNTKYEAHGIADIIGGCDCREILEENELKRVMGDYHTVHLATHGYSLNPQISERPRYIDSEVAVDQSLLYSGVALTNANNVGGLTRGQDGILSAREICNLDLSGVDLVVLSACETARASVVDEGVTGLIRALKMAGVKTIIASLWEVDDAATRYFMEEFYRNLKSGRSKKDAFDAAIAYIENFRKTVTPRKYNAGKMARNHKKDATGNPIEYQPYDKPSFYAPFILIDAVP